MIEQITKSKLLKHFLRSPTALGSSIGLLLLLLGAIFASIIAPQNPYNLENLDLGNSLLPPVWVANGHLPFILGTDEQGRDILSTIFYGLRTSLAVGFGATLVSGIAGIIIGLVAGFYERTLGAPITRISDVVYSFDPMLVAILFMGLLGHRGIFMVILALAPVETVRYIRTTRGKILALKNLDYVEAARAIGASNLRIMIKHLLPNSLGPLVVIATVDLAILIMLEATLSFLGIGVPVTKPSLGLLISSGKEYLYGGCWWLTVFPGLALISLVLCINLLGDWLRDELNPKVITR
jgi:peptide/nickel transport system permease protein